MKRVAQTRILNDSELEKTIAAMQKAYGINSVTTANLVRQPYRIATGIFPLDYALLGGIPHNRISMFSGPKHSGKTSLAERCIRGAQVSLPDQKPAFVDVEGTRDATWGEKLGVDNANLIYSLPSSGEQAVDMAEALVRTREISLLVLDSVAALVPLKEIDESVEDNATPGLQAKLMARCVRKLTAALIDERKRDHFITVILINQQRSKIGGWSPTGDPVHDAGGKAVGYSTTLEINCKNKENLNKEGETDYNEHAFDIKKWKLSGGLRKGDYTVLRKDKAEYGLAEGAVDDAATMLAFAKTMGWYSGGGKSWTLQAVGEYDAVTFENSDQAIRTLYQDPEYYWALRTALIVQNAQNQKMPEDFISYLRGEV
jgi:recombination protein RecA